MLRKVTKSVLAITYFLVCLHASVNAQNITTKVGVGTAGYSGDGSSAVAAQVQPSGVCLDAANNIYIAEYNNNIIRKVSASTGVISTIAGTGTAGYSGDGGLATSALMNNPASLAVDLAGNVYFSDVQNHVVRKITVTTGIITTIAGTGTAGSTGDGGLATSALLFTPRGVYVDAANMIYIADQTSNVIRKINASTGIISTVAGTGTAGYSGDGGLATAAQLSEPFGIFVDASSNIYIADKGNNAIRKVTASTGIISTIAGTGVLGATGDGGLATAALLNVPLSVSLDGNNNLYIGEVGNGIVRKITASTGIITRFAGNGTTGFSGDGALATNAQLYLPMSVAADAAGNVYIADNGNNRIRKVTVSTTSLTNTGILDSKINIYPNPSNGKFIIHTEKNNLELTMYTITGKKVFETQLSQLGSNEINVSDYPKGIYVVKINNPENAYTQTIIIQ